MHHVQVDRVIDQPVDTVWAALDDFGGVYRYHPLVEKSLISNAISSGLGAERVCHFDDGNSIREEITAYEPGRAYEVEIVDPGKFPLKRAIARLSVEPLDNDRSRVGFEMAFRPKFGPLGWVMGKTLMVPQFKKILGRVLEGLEKHLETGEVVSRRPPTPATAHTRAAARKTPSATVHAPAAEAKTPSARAQQREHSHG